MSNKKPIVDKGIILYYDYDFILNFLSNEEVGILIRQLLKHRDNPSLNPTSNNSVNNAFNYIANRIIDYKEKKKLASKWGSKGGNPTLLSSEQKPTLNPPHKTGVKLKEKKIKENKRKEIKRKEEKMNYLSSLEENFKKPMTEWLEYRIKLTDIKQWEYQYKFLKKVVAKTGHNPYDIVQQSIGNGYTGLFAIKNNPIVEKLNTEETPHEKIAREQREKEGLK
jgi:hypothetical protein